MADLRSATASRLAITLLCGLLCASGGCGAALRGHWKLEKAVPNKVVFAFDDMVFNRDGTFSGVVTLDGKTTEERGTYEYRRLKLVLHPQGGGRRAYNTLIRSRTLQIMDGERKAFLRKVK